MKPRTVNERRACERLKSYLPEAFDGDDLVGLPDFDIEMSGEHFRVKPTFQIQLPPMRTKTFIDMVRALYNVSLEQK